MSKNTKFNKSITMILTLLLLVSSVPSFGAGPTFKDTSGHWAYEYIEDMAKLGYINGFPGGDFKPDGNLTLMQAISTLSRFTEPTAGEKSNALSGYAYLFNELNIEQDWEKEGLAIALFKDMISEKEVRDAKNNNIFNKAINRERVAELLAKSMGFEEKANDIDIVVVNYIDILKTDASKRKYLRVLLDAGVLDPNGKGNKDFQPKANLTRAEMSTLLSKGANYLKRNPIESVEPEPVEYEYVTDVIKRITKDAGTMLVIENAPDKEKAYRIEDNTSITIDGVKSKADYLSAGQEVKLKIEKGTITIASIEAFSAEENLSGVAKYVFNTNNKITLEYKVDKEILTKDYYVDSNARIYLNEKLAKLKDIKDGDLVELKLKNNIITEIEASSKTKKVRGIIKEITPIKDGKNTYYLITVEDKDEVSHKYLTDSKTDIVRKDRRAGGDELRVKDDAYIDGDYDLAQDNFIAVVIDADVVKRTLKGQVTETVKRLNKNTLVTIVNHETKEEESYDLSSNVEIIIDSKSEPSLPSDPGYYAEIELENDEIVGIYIDSKRAQNSITGRIVDIDYRQKTITLEENNLNNYSTNTNKIVIYTTLGTSYLKTTEGTGKIEDTSFGNLVIGDIVMVGGVHKGINFEANLIIIR